MHAVVVAFAQNLVLPLAVVFCYGLLLRWRNGLPRQIVAGVLFGGGAVLAMLMPIRIADGILIDNRIAVVLLAGLFAGAPAAVGAALIASTYRAFLGGGGAIPGILCICSVAVLGTLIRYALRRRQRQLGVRHCFGAGLASVLVTLPWTFALPEESHPALIFGQIAGPIALMYPFSATVLGLLLILAERQEQSEQALHRHREELARIVAVRTADLEQARLAAENANRAKSTFLASLSHEIRTPLNAVLGYAQLLARDARLAPEHRQSVAVIGRSGEHLLALINDVLEMSRIEAGRTTVSEVDVDLHDLLAGVVALFRPRAADKGLALDLVLASDLPRGLRCDPRLLRQILINLLANAVKFTQQGTVTVHAARWGGAGHAPRLRIAVRDTGPGLSGDEQAQLFQPFAQAGARPQREGFGLGLALSQGFAHALSGGISVESAPGAGATFVLDLPLRETLAPAPPPVWRTAIGLAPGQVAPRVLIAEDHAESRAVLCQLLADIGVVVEGVGDGDAVVARAVAWAPQLIFMDIDLPGRDGLEATRAICAKPNAPVIVAVTASAFRSDDASVLAAGCTAVIHKPYREADIFACLERQLGLRLLWSDAAGDDGGAMSAEARDALRAALAILPAAQRRELHALLITGDMAAIVVATAAWQDRACADGVRILAERMRIQLLTELIAPVDASG